MLRAVRMLGKAAKFLLYDPLGWLYSMMAAIVFVFLAAFAFWDGG